MGIVQVPQEELDASGGHIFNSARGGLFGKKYLGSPIDPWEVIDKKGDVVFRTSDEQSAVAWAVKNNYSTDKITWKQLKNTREFYRKNKWANNFKN